MPTTPRTIGETPCLRTYSTDHVVQPFKYVQAVGLFIFGLEGLKNRPTRTGIKGTSEDIETRLRIFLSVAPQRLFPRATPTTKTVRLAFANRACPRLRGGPPGDQGREGVPVLGRDGPRLFSARLIQRSACLRQPVRRTCLRRLHRHLHHHQKKPGYLRDEWTLSRTAIGPDATLPRPRLLPLVGRGQRHGA